MRNPASAGGRQLDPATHELCRQKPDQSNMEMTCLGGLPGQIGAEGNRVGAGVGAGGRREAGSQVEAGQAPGLLRCAVGFHDLKCSTVGFDIQEGWIPLGGSCAWMGPGKAPKQRAPRHPGAKANGEEQGRSKWKFWQGICVKFTTTTPGRVDSRPDKEPPLRSNQNRNPDERASTRTACKEWLKQFTQRGSTHINPGTLWLAGRAAG